MAKEVGKGVSNSVKTCYHDILHVATDSCPAIVGCGLNCKYTERKEAEHRHTVNMHACH